jgi:hypothetical protein
MAFALHLLHDAHDSAKYRKTWLCTVSDPLARLVAHPTTADAPSGEVNKSHVRRSDSEQ